MDLILKKSEKLFNDCKNYEKKFGKVPADWQGVATVAMGAIKDAQTFGEAAEPLMKWMAENQHPHTTVIVRCNYAELFEGLQCHLNDEFIVD